MSESWSIWKKKNPYVFWWPEVFCVESIAGKNTWFIFLLCTRPLCNYNGCKDHPDPFQECKLYSLQLQYSAISPLKNCLSSGELPGPLSHLFLVAPYIQWLVKYKDQLLHPNKGDLWKFTSASEFTVESAYAFFEPSFSLCLCFLPFPSTGSDARSTP